jgi:hypothetical protein
MTYAACLDLDTNLSRSGFWDLSFYDFPGCAWFANLRYFHSRHKIGLLSVIEFSSAGGANSARHKTSEIGEDLPIL